MKRAPTGGPGAEPVAARVAEPVALLAQARCDDPRPLRHGALIGWLDWIRRPVRRGSALDPALPVSRVQHLLSALEQDEALAAQVAAALAQVGREMDAASLLADHGFALRQALSSEIARRLGQRWLPRTPDTDDLAELFRLLLRPQDAAWLAALDGATLARLHRLFANAWPVGTPEALANALTLLSSAVTATALSPSLRRRMAAELLDRRPFRHLNELCADLLRQVQGGAPELHTAALLRAVIERCHECAATVFEHLEQHGVSVDIVFAVEQLQGRLDRMAALLDCLLAPTPPAAAAAWRDLLLQLLAANGEQEGLRQLLGHHYSLLARQTAIRHAETGEHYIASDRAGWFDMLRRAAGGGAVIAGTTLLKFAIGTLGLTTLWAGVGAGLNYAASFVLIMLLHWTVATKQPAMTAPAMAEALAKVRPGNDNAAEIEAFVDRVAQLVRSQAVGILGNVALCFPVVLAAQWLARWIGGAPLVGSESARYVLHGLDPLGASLPFAAFTGVLLFASSLVAGWAENAFVFHRLDSALRWNPGIVRRLGAERAARWSAWWRNNISGLAGNVSLGLMLGILPALAAILGLGLEVRHVTLSTGQLAAALGALGWELLRTASFWGCVATVAGIGLINLGVSFWFAWRLALRSRGIRVAERQRIGQALRWRLRSAPLSFLLPPRA